MTNNGKLYGKIIYLAQGRSLEEFSEITEAEYEKVLEKEADRLSDSLV